MLHSFICRQRVTNTFILSLINKLGTQQCLQKTPLLFSNNIFNASICSFYLSSYDLSKRYKGPKKSKMTSPTGSSSPEILDILPADQKEMAEIANAQRKRKTVAENLRDNVLKWEATHASERSQQRISETHSSSPELIELSSSEEDDDSKHDLDDFEVIEVVPQQKPRQSSTYRALYSRGCPLTKRHWEDTPYATKIKREGLPRKSFPFSVMSYNLLAQDLLEQHPDLYEYHKQSCLPWSVRHSGIMREIKHHFPDILCLQEVQATHAQQFVMQPLSNLGYQGIYKQRTGGKVDGCAILWQQEKFELVEQTSVEFYQPGVDILNRDNIALVVRLRVQGSNDEIVVASTHLLYNPRREDVRLAQMQLLLAEIDRVSHTDLPVILTGDFNLQPHTSVYQLLARGQLKMDSRYTSDWVPTHLGITDCCRHSSLLAHRQMIEYLQRDSEVMATELSMLKLYHTERKCDTSQHHSPLKHHTFRTGNLSHDLKLRSVHNHSFNIHREQEEASTHQDDWVTVDYIFYSEELENSKLNRRRLKLLSRWTLPTVAECRVLGPIPNLDAPSDHLPLVACFVLN